MIRIGIVAGEVSGDYLGADLIQALKQQHPNQTLKFEGIAGPLMIEQGCEALFPMEKLALFGIVEILGHLPEVLAIRRQLLQHFISNPPDIFIGIDAPDFNLSLEKNLKQADIKTVHYVSPTVWAWRQSRVKKIQQSVDLILSIFPFEVEFYQKYQVPVCFVGHPFADQIPLQSDRQKARAELKLEADKTMIALLPGSRRSEINYLGRLFFETASKCWQNQPQLQFVVPVVNSKIRQCLETLLKDYPDLPVTLFEGQSRQVLTAANIVLTTSGTSTLETLLVKRPMVVAYKISPITYQLLKWLNMVKINLFAMPNLLAGKQIVPEFIQDQATVANLSQALLEFLNSADKVEQLLQDFEQIHLDLRKDASQEAARAVSDLFLSVSGASNFSDKR